MSMNELIFRLIEVAFLVILTVVSRYLIPWLRTRLDGTKYELAYQIVEHLVQAAEQTITYENAGRDRYERVINSARAILQRYGIEMTNDQIDTLIESAVYALKDGVIEVPMPEYEEGTDE